MVLIRFEPISWYDETSMRVEIYGCPQGTIVLYIYLRNKEESTIICSVVKLAGSCGAQTKCKEKHELHGWFFILLENHEGLTVFFALHRARLNALTDY